MGIFKTSDAKEIIEEKKEREAARVEQAFADRLSLVLVERGISKKDFAEDIGVAPSTLSGYVNGSHMPDFVTFDILCSQLDVSADYLLGRTDNPNVDTEHTRNENELLSYYKLISEKSQNRVIGEVREIARVENRLRRK